MPVGLMEAGQQEKHCSSQFWENAVTAVPEFVIVGIFWWYDVLDFVKKNFVKSLNRVNVLVMLHAILCYDNISLFLAFSNLQYSQFALVRLSG